MIIRFFEKIAIRLPWHIHVHRKVPNEYLVYACRCGDTYHDHDWVY